MAQKVWPVDYFEFAPGASFDPTKVVLWADNGVGTGFVRVSSFAIAIAGPGETTPGKAIAADDQRIVNLTNAVLITKNNLGNLALIADLPTYDTGQKYELFLNGTFICQSQG